MKLNAWLLMGLIVLAGCADDKGPRKFNIKGKVTYDGTPLVSGQMTFVPDSDRGNSGPPGYAVVRDGKFSTEEMGGKASVSGPIKVLITGFDMSAEEGAESKPPLFEDFLVVAEIDPGQRLTTLDFDVPEVAKPGQKKSRKVSQTK